MAVISLLTCCCGYDDFKTFTVYYPGQRMNRYTCLQQGQIPLLFQTLLEMQPYVKPTRGEIFPKIEDIQSYFSAVKKQVPSCVAPARVGVLDEFTTAGFDRLAKGRRTWDLTLSISHQVGRQIYTRLVEWMEGDSMSEPSTLSTGSLWCVFVSMLLPQVLKLESVSVLRWPIPNWTHLLSCFVLSYEDLYKNILWISLSM